MWSVAYVVMKVIDKLQLNKFVNVSVPRNKDLYARVGGRIPQMGTSGFVSELGKDKLQILSDADEALNAEYQQELKKNQMPLSTPI